MHCQWGRAHQGVLPAAGCLLLLLKVFWAALMQPGQLLQEGGALDNQRLAFTDPIVKGRLGREAAACVLTVALQLSLDILDAVC